MLNKGAFLHLLIFAFSLFLAGALAACEELAMEKTESGTRATPKVEAQPENALPTRIVHPTRERLPERSARPTPRVTALPWKTSSPGPSPSPTMSPSAVYTEPTLTPVPTQLETSFVGYSASGLPIISYRIGIGETKIVFVGGIHGGYEWNTTLLAYRALEYFRAQPQSIPDSISVYIVPSANPDGLLAVTGKVGRLESGELISDTRHGRFNSRGVDLNRNWDCLWAPTANWRDELVSAGEQPFSEPSSIALRDLFLVLDPAAVLFWHSAAEGVYAAGCHETHPPSYQLAIVYGLAAEYPIYERFDHYPVTGDAGDWLTTLGIPTFTVELKTHESIDWDQNLAGMIALLSHFKKQSVNPIQFQQ